MRVRMKFYVRVSAAATFLQQCASQPHTSTLIFSTSTILLWSVNWFFIVLIFILVSFELILLLSALQCAKSISSQLNTHYIYQIASDCIGE